ncbi:hypothetical protein DPMN_012399 [Dreissena polymorpha]|uniref:Uncharacterized protein n=1 Tax=Dreissena polymorpha TaxID=45954 RepID=A0A9D4N5G1_DREPO|nr:hypothetical protein DPMN_012399 [Dreissena polymorpha]
MSMPSKDEILRSSPKYSHLELENLRNQDMAKLSFACRPSTEVAVAAVEVVAAVAAVEGVAAVAVVAEVAAVIEQ